MVASLVALAKALNSSVVAEGVAANDDLLQLEAMGVEFAQANLLCPAVSLKKLLSTGYFDDPVYGTVPPPAIGKHTLHNFEQRRAALSMAAGAGIYT